MVNVPRGSVENVPSRQAGKENKGLLSPIQDYFTESRRQKYGETERGSPQRDTNVITETPNDIKPKDKREMREYLNNTDMARRSMCS
jgi:hypothetical protein